MGINRESELKELLDKQHNWPESFLFKFIFKSNTDAEDKLKDIFNNEAEIKVKQSKKENYKSISATILAKSSDEVLSVYKKASEIEGVISL